MTIKTESEKLSYSFGVSVANNLLSQGIEDIDAKAFGMAIEDVVNDNDLQVSPEDATRIIQNFFMDLQKKKHEKNISEGEKFLAENKEKEGVITLESGLQYKVLKEGNGKTPYPNDTVTTHYHGTLIDGTVFDSSVQRNQPATFPVNGVIAGWTEALQLMKEGDKWQLFIPYNLAYGANGAGQVIEPYSTLIFEVELISINQ